MLQLRARLDLDAMAMKGCSTFPKLHYWSLTFRLFGIISRTFISGVLLLYRDTVGVFCCSSWLGPSDLTDTKLHLMKPQFWSCGGVENTPLFLLLPNLLWFGLVLSIRVPSGLKLFGLDKNAWYRKTMNRLYQIYLLLEAIIVQHELFTLINLNNLCKIKWF